ncbi:MAG: hypothetical protein M0013_01770 [Actinomycetota bacterium]|nr:hypothetical protein [Actinomycetota bacterium]
MIDPQDEFMHEPTDDPQFNESMYFNFVDGGSGFATLVRIGNRVNEGHAEVTALVYQPGGGAVIHFDRSPITDNNAFDTDGLRVDVRKPLEHLQLTYNGKGHQLERGTDLADPKAALSAAPEVPLELDLAYESLIDLYGLSSGDGAGGGIEGGESTIATGHYQGPCRVHGTITVGDERHAVSGLGFRDHSWGPRRWQGPTYWRWISCMCDEANGFVVWVSRIGDTVPKPHGMVLLDGAFRRIDDANVTSTYGPAPYYPETMRMHMETQAGPVDATGEVFAMVPLRHRREGQVARLGEALVRYELEGREGFGIAEYHDLMIDGVPAGMSEA